VVIRKSSNVGQNHERRIKILRAISKQDFKVLSIVIDKRKLTGRGYNFTYPFRVNLHEKLYRVLFDAFPRLRIVADCCGDATFLKKWKKYIIGKHPLDLFKWSSFQFVNSESEVLVQLADFITGSLARHYDATKRTPHSTEILQELKNQLLRIDEWPPNNDRRMADLADAGYQFDLEIADMACRKADKLITTLGVSQKEEEIARSECLQYLLLSFDIDPSRYISTDELLEKICALELGKRQFRLKIMGPLRDAGAIIVSSEAGYKIPYCDNDIRRYLNHAKRTVVPMLSRIEQFHEAVKTAKLGEVDYWELPEYEVFRRAFTRLGEPAAQRSSVQGAPRRGTSGDAGPIQRPGLS